jgi:hypothetical protein
VSFLHAVQVKVSQCYVMSDSQSGCLSRCQAPIWDLRPDFFLTAVGLLMWGTLSDERMGVFYNVKCTLYLHFTCCVLAEVKVAWQNYNSMKKVLYHFIRSTVIQIC